MTTSTDDPILDGEVEHALAPYRSLLPPEALAILRATLLQAYTEHPAGQRILEHLRAEAANVGESGEVLTLKGNSMAPGAVRALAPAAGRGKGR